jgi:hypothetical protein
VRVLFDDHALYFGCMFFDSDPGRIVARLTRRDDEVESDWGSIRIDTYHDHQTGYEITFNPAGVKVDILQFEDGNKEDESWDAVWELETAISPLGWSAEIVIPFRILRYRTDDADSAEQEWGINFMRTISRKKETDRWAFTPKKESGFISRFGHLRGLKGLPVPRRVELLPFVVGREEWTPAMTARDRSVQFTGVAGLDLKYGLSNNLTLDATVNPDFGQVEADPAVLNLTTFETFYPEKRPFFIEGTQILRFATFGDGAGPGMFYSRRIGRAISSDEIDLPDNGRIEEVPQHVAILGAAKVSGKTNGGLSLGILEAVTKREKAIASDAAGFRSGRIVEPLAHYNIIRLKQDVLDGSNVGMIFTSVAKETRPPALTGGGDWNLKFDSRTLQLDGFLAVSQTTARTNERLSGSAGRIQYGRIASEHWLWSISGDFTSPGYNINDAGFFRRPDDWGCIGSLTYKEDVPSDMARSYSVSLTGHERRNFDNENLIRELRLQARMLFNNYWSLNAALSFDHGGYDDRETRGSGLYQKPGAWTSSLSVETDNRDLFTVDLQQGFDWDRHGRVRVRTELELEAKPVSWMAWELATGLDIVRHQESWVANEPLATGTVTLFGDRSTDAYNFTLRGTVTFTKDLTLQVYSQVFLAKGHYENFRRLLTPSEFAPSADIVNHDFNERSLNVNLVLRWEYLPGSTAFLVWSQAREGADGDYYSTFRRDLVNAFGVPPANVILLKVSYWWSF